MSYKTELFKDIPDDVHDRMFKRLQEMRSKYYQEYRDDELLMYLLCVDNLPQSRD